jgi:hypothetical protein
VFDAYILESLAEHKAHNCKPVTGVSSPVEFYRFQFLQVIEVSINHAAEAAEQYAKSLKEE